MTEPIYFNCWTGLDLGQWDGTEYTYLDDRLYTAHRVIALLMPKGKTPNWNWLYEVWISSPRGRVRLGEDTGKMLWPLHAAKAQAQQVLNREWLVQHGLIEERDE